VTESELSELEAFFKDFDFPTAAYLAPFERVLDPRKFVDANIAILRARRGEKAYIPYYNRLLKFKSLLVTG
jgi:hypothetical protein